MSTYNNEYFIEKVNKIHHNKYQYPEEYVNSRIKIKIICPIHGGFYLRGDAHLSGKGCKKCTLISRDKEIIHINGLKFISKAKLKHKNLYDYTKCEYKHYNNKVTIICPIHGEFTQTPLLHLHGHGCVHCGVHKRTASKEKFIKKAKLIEIHKNRNYDYSQVNYIHSQIKVKIICPKHGEFLQKPNCHLQGQGCPGCKSSIGEFNIRNFLIKNNIKFTEQKTFDNCKHKKLLKFDFYLDSYNKCIEYQGRQHYDGWSNNKEYLKISKIRDEIKKNYCKNKNIELYEITYKDDINEKLQNLLNNIQSVT